MPRVGLTTSRVVREGADLADEVGFDRVSVSEVARRCGVRVASLYSHVRSSDDLREGITLLALADLADRCAAALAGRAGRDALTALATVFRRYAVEHPGRYAAARHRLPAEVAATSAGPRIAELTRAVLRGYGLGPDDETHAVRLIGSVVHGYVSLELAGAFDHSRPPSDESWERVLVALDAMLAGWRTTHH